MLWKAGGMMKYKLQIINYRPYEYELFQEKLDRLGQQGYSCDDLSFISIFKKEDHPVYYKIDFFNVQGKSRNEKMNSRQILYDPYLEEDYMAVYAKKGMYVFIGDHPIDDIIDWSKKKDIIAKKRRTRSELTLTAALFISIAIVYYMLYSFDVTSFLSYGIAIFYLGVILGCITAIYRSYCNNYQLKAFIEKLKDGAPHLSHLKILRKIYTILCSLSLICMLGGLFEDLINARSFTQEQHQILTLADLDIDSTTELSTQMYSGFLTPHTYISLEAGQDDEILYIKEYQFYSKDLAQYFIDDLINDPSSYQCDRVTVEDSVIYGYYEDQISTIIVQDQTNITMISYGFVPSDEQIQETIDFYS